MCIPAKKQMPPKAGATGRNFGSLKPSCFFAAEGCQFGTDIRIKTDGARFSGCWFAGATLYIMGGKSISLTGNCFDGAVALRADPSISSIALLGNDFDRPRSIRIAPTRFPAYLISIEAPGGAAGPSVSWVMLGNWGLPDSGPRELPIYF